MAEKNLKKCSTSLVIREMQTKRTLRFYLTPVRMANSGDSRCWQGCGERRTLLHCWCHCKLEISLAVPQKIGHNTTGGPCYTTPGHIPRGFPGMLQGHMLHYVHSSLIYNSQELERTQMSFNRGKDTEIVVYLHSEKLLSYSKQ